MSEEDVDLTVDEKPMRGFRVRPDNPKGAVIVIPEAFGLNDHIRTVTRRFAEEGFVAFAIDIFHRSGADTAPYDDFGKVMSLFEGLTDEGLTADLSAAIKDFEHQGVSRHDVAVVGFCFGGRVAFLAGLRFDLGAAVSFYGGGIVTQGAFPAFPPLLDSLTELQTPFLGLFGDLDRSISISDVEQLRAALVEHAPSVEAEIHRYDDADHGFHCDERPSFNEQASRDAWARTIGFIRQHVT